LFVSYGADKLAVKGKLMWNEIRNKMKNNKIDVRVHMNVFSVLEFTYDMFGSDFVFFNTVFLKFYLLIYIFNCDGSRFIYTI
jgi:hypothetical protein